MQHRCVSSQVFTGHGGKGLPFCASRDCSAPDLPQRSGGIPISSFIPNAGPELRAPARAVLVCC